MRKEIVEIEPGDLEDYKALMLECAALENGSGSSVDYYVNTQRRCMEMELYIIEKYGDEDHKRGNWMIDPVVGYLYIDD